MVVLGKPYKAQHVADSMSSYLLVVGCSDRKNTSPFPMKALDRYEGVNFKVIKKFNREKGFPDNMDIAIVSARYGLITSDEYIDLYDIRMTRKRAAVLHPEIMDDLKDLISGKTYKEVFVVLGKEYMRAIEGIELIAPCPVVYARGRIGEKMAALKKWLNRVFLAKEGQQKLTDLKL
ncbi:MAG: hypothetical protein HXS41_07950 [Theionarchaea archaeon]|nr:hypothetical protein [Theionarchaea archaeon]MBU7020979.1 hypothetical protein [Theionarchaea archaeon]MBU7034383.1 hypothetical protein [Theionarchaea archaeon]MBU7040054.1 hypothetical protein [Theionarchaea archaeon]